MKKLSHIDEKGHARMVDVGNKGNKKRTARAEGIIRLQPATLTLIKEDKISKGSVLNVSEIAGIQGAKKTSELIPLCHPLPVNHIKVSAQLTQNGVKVESEVSYTGKTGVEMEALTAVNVALLTVYDMCKSVDKNMIINDIYLVDKQKEEL